MGDKTSGVFNLQQKRAERLVASAISGVHENGDAFVRFNIYPEAGVFGIPSEENLEIRSDVAFDLVGLIHVLLAALVWLGGAEVIAPDQRVASPVVRTVGPPRHRILECRFDTAESFKLMKEPDGLCTLEFSPHVAERLARGLASELGRIAARISDDDRGSPAT